MDGVKQRVTYSKEMRDRAKADKKHLITLDVPGMTFQGPCTNEQVKEVHSMFQRWMKEKRTKGN